VAQFSESATAIASIAGTATVRVRGPWRNGTVWHMGQAVLTATQGAADTACTAELFRSIVQRSTSMGTSLNADADTMEGLAGDVFQAGDQLLVVFAGCAPGTVCSVTFTGNEVEL
jgi:hypothetical protein